jgi:hypothetical protein
MYNPDVFRIHRVVWAGPATVCGLILASLALWRGRIALVDGVLEAHGPAIAWVLSHVVPLRGGVAAITFGHVVIGRDAASLACSRAHERVHVRQYERWGPAFIPAYLIAGLSAAFRRRHPYFANPFEIEAFRAEGRQA